LAAPVTDPRGIRAIAGGDIGVQLASAAVNIRAISTGIVPSSAWGAVAMHVIFAAGFAVVLVTANKAQRV
jgi:hypothetical protein